MVGYIVPAYTKRSTRVSSFKSRIGLGGCYETDLTILTLSEGPGKTLTLFKLILFNFLSVTLQIVCNESVCTIHVAMSCVSICLSLSNQHFTSYKVLDGFNIF